MIDQVHKEILEFFNYLKLDEPQLTQTEDTDIGITVIEISTQNQDLFMENNKELLFAFNYILKKLVEKKDKNISFVLDFDGEQKKLINEAKQKAHIAYTRVIQYEKPYEFGYLNGFERMIIHSYLKEKTDVVTSSTGQGRERRLRILKNNS